MAYPKKKMGFRKIVVNDMEFRWRYGWDCYDGTFVTIQDMVSGSNSIYVTLNAIPESITPKNIRQWLLLAIEKGWRPNIKNPKETKVLDFELENQSGSLIMGIRR